MSRDSRALLPLAESIADGSPVDWKAIEPHVTPDERAVLRELRVLANLAVLHRSLPADAAVSQLRKSAPTPAVGTWGHLDLLERLGGGTFGEVYRAWDRRLEREVALKLLRVPDGADNRTTGRAQEDPEASRIAREGRLLARVRHPNVITVFGVDVHDDRVGLCMELVRGVTLEQIVKKDGAFGAREAILIGVDLCRALAAVHAAGLIHRDVKAQNVMRESGGRIVLMDLGTGRESGAAAQPAMGDLAGTPLYLAPEIFDGAPASPRTDLYSLGVLLYRLVTGAFPARATTIDELRSVHANGRAVRLRDARPDLPAAFVRTVERAIDADPSRRYATAGALEADLSRALDDATPAFDARAVRDRGRLTWRPAAIAAAIVAVIALGGIYWTATHPPGAGGAAAPIALPIRSIAVLPLTNLTKNPAQEYFVDGMTDELISTLGRIEGLNVISRTSVVQFKNATTPLPQIAELLKVDAFLEGSVMFEPGGGSGGGQPGVRINARLIRAGTDTRIMDKSFVAVLSDVLSLQTLIATAVAEAIELELTARERQSLAARPQDPDTLDLYLRGRYYWNMRGEEGLKRSIQYFQEAISRDKGFARAHAGLADAYSMLARYGFMPRNEGLAQAATAASTAIALDGSLAEAHTSLALVRMERLEWEPAANSFKQALELNPGYGSAHHWHSAFLARRGQLTDAMAAIDRASAIDPLSQTVKAQRVALLLLSRRVDDAIGEIQRLVQANPGYARGHMRLAEAYAQKGTLDLASQEIARAAALGERTVEVRAYAGYIHALAGRKAEAVTAAEALAEQSRRNEEGAAGAAAVVYAALGDRDRAFEWLDTALKLRDPWIAYLKVDPKWDTLRQDPRFERLLASAGLPR